MKKALLAVLLLVSHSAQAAPCNGVLRILNPATPGSTMQAIGMLFGEHLKERHGISYIVESMPGGSHTRALAALERAAGDPCTLFSASNVMATNFAVMMNAPYDPSAFSALGLIGRGTLTYVAHVSIEQAPGLPVRTLQEFIGYARAHPEVLTYAHPGTGSVFHVAMELLKLEANITLQPVPYGASGSAQIRADLAGGHVLSAVMAMHHALPLIAEGKVSALAQTGAERNSDLPHVQTLHEAGFGTIDIDSWFGILGPPRLSTEAVQFYVEEIRVLLRTRKALDELKKIGLVQAKLNPTSFSALISKDVERWRHNGERLNLLK